MEWDNKLFSIGMKNWLKRRNTPDSGSMLLPRSKGKLQRKFLNIERRIAIFIMGILFRNYRSPQRPELEKISSVLIIPHDPIGDLVITSPLWNTLKKRNPQIKIGVVCSARNRDVLINEDVDSIYDLYSPNPFHVFKQMRLARRNRWDVVLSTAGFYKPTRFALISRFIAGKGITATMHTARPERYARIYSFCFKRPTEDEHIPMAEQYQTLAEKVFAIKFTENERLPQFTIDPESKIRTDLRIDKILNDKKHSRFILINLEAKVPYREWGIENVEMLAKAFYDAKIEVFILLSASTEFQEYYQLDKLHLKTPNAEVFPTDNIHDLATVIDRASLVISPDTAVVHIAAALRKKIIAFYPSLDEWLPYGVESTILCPDRWEPISTISVTKVFSTAVSLLENED